MGPTGKIGQEFRQTSVLVLSLFIHKEGALHVALTMEYSGFVFLWLKVRSMFE